MPELPEKLSFFGHDLLKKTLYPAEDGYTIWEGEFVLAGSKWRVKAHWMPENRRTLGHTKPWYMDVSFEGGSSMGSGDTWEEAQADFWNRVKPTRDTLDALKYPPERYSDYLETGLRYILSTAMIEPMHSKDRATAAYAAVMLQKLGLEVSSGVLQELGSKGGTDLDQLAEVRDQMGQFE